MAITYTFNHQLIEHWSEKTLRQTSWLRFEPANPLSFEECIRRFVRPMAQFISLATGRRNHVIRLDLEQSGTEAGSTSETGEWIDAWFTESGRHQEQGRLTLEDMLFTLEDVGVRFADTIRAAFEITSKYKAAVNAFIAVYYDLGIYGEQRFLDLARAVESFHREDRRGHPDPNTDDDASRLQAILEMTPREHQDWLKKALRHISEPTFRRRLKDLLKEVAPFISSVLKPKPKTLTQRIYEARNSLTHLDKNGVAPEPQLLRLFQLSETLGHIMEALLLRRLGFPNEDVRRIFERNHRYQMTAARAAGVL
jgi:hypothetical protein